MNELAESGADSEDDSDDDGFLLSKSKSVPNLDGHCQPGPSRSDEVVRLRKKAKDKIMLDPCELSFRFLNNLRNIQMRGIVSSQRKQRAYWLGPKLRDRRKLTNLEGRSFVYFSSY